MHVSSNYVDDLAHLPAQQLRKLTDKEARSREQNGIIYTEYMRQLQIRPNKYTDFYETVLRPVRNKHIDLLKRGTGASVRQLSDLFLRGHGYIIWVANSIWQLPESDLSTGETPLSYVRPVARVKMEKSEIESENFTIEDENPLFYPILADLWAMMRNTIFEDKGTPQKRGRRSQPLTHNSTSETETDVDAHCAGTDPHLITHQVRMRSNLQSRNLLQSVVAYSRRTDYESTALRRPLTTDEAEAAIVDLITHLHIIRSASDERVFDELFVRQLARLDEIEIGEGISPTPTTSDVISSPSTPPSYQEPSLTARKALSNEPFMTTGNPMPPTAPLSLLIPPTIPSEMSIYISTARLSPYLTTALLVGTDISMMITPHSASSATATAYHWPSAPVRTSDMSRFFSGVNYRVADNPDTIVSYILSYGWNDTCRCITSGLQEVAVSRRIKTHQTTNSALHSDSAASDAMDLDVDLNINETPAPEKPRKEKWEPGLEQWQYMRGGWAEFQNDITHAAKMGVSIWRMKVCVLTLSAGIAE